MDGGLTSGEGQLSLIDPMLYTDHLDSGVVVTVTDVHDPCPDGSTMFDLTTVDGADTYRLVTTTKDDAALVEHFCWIKARLRVLATPAPETIAQIVDDEIAVGLCHQTRRPTPSLVRRVMVHQHDSVVK